MKDHGTFSVQLDDDGWREIGDGTVFYWASEWSPTPPFVTEGTWTDADLAANPGHWALVDLRGPSPKLTVDRQRSRPLLAARAGGRWMIADNVEAFRPYMPFKKNKKVAEVFRHFGHTVGHETLVRNIWDTPAGSTMTLRKTAEVEPYLIYRSDTDPVTTQEEYTELLTVAADAAFGRLLQQVGDRQLVVPISAGFDSRFVLTWLRRLGATNVVTYSYGLPHAPERETSTAVAKALGYPFHFVSYSPEELRAAWDEDAATRYVRESWGATSLPHKQDWYAVRELTASGVIEPGAIVMPGHTLCAVPAVAPILAPEPDLDLVAREFAVYAGSQQREPENVVKNRYFQSVLQEHADRVGFGDNPRDNLTLWRWMGLQHRQSKFITNSVRVYEHFGLNWAMPLHEPEIWQARQSGSDELTRGRAGYKQTITERFNEVAVGPLPEPPPHPASPPAKPAAAKPVGIKQRLGRSKLGQLLTNNGLTKRWYRANHPIRSPLGTDVFRPELTKLQVMMSRSALPTGNGMSADALLAGKGHGNKGLFD